MTRTLTPRLHVYGVIATTALLAGLVLGRPELVAVAAPLALGLLAGLLGARHVELIVRTDVERRRALEGELLDWSLSVLSDRPIARLILTPKLPPGLELDEVQVDPADGAVAIRGEEIILNLRSGRPRRVSLSVRCVSWGGYPAIDIRFVTTDLFGLFRHEMTHSSEVALKVLPTAEHLRRLLTPLDTQLSVGELQSRRRGAGIEFSELRPFTPGDDLRRINWRASARRDRLWLNEQHPDDNGDVVLLVDTVSGDRHPESFALDYAVRAVASLARGHLGRRDRVGLIVFGGVVRWIRPTTLADQRYQILDALADSRYRGGGLNVTTIPHRALPPHALVIGLSPLLEAEATEAFVQLRGRGTDLAIIEVPTAPFLAAPDSDEQRLARRVWELERDQMRRRFRGRGVAVVRWDPSLPFINALEEVSAFRAALARR